MAGWELLFLGAFAPPPTEIPAPDALIPLYKYLRGKGVHTLNPKPSPPNPKSLQAELSESMLRKIAGAQRVGELHVLHFGRKDPAAARRDEPSF